MRTRPFVLALALAAVAGTSTAWGAMGGTAVGDYALFHHGLGQGSLHPQAAV